MYGLINRAIQCFVRDTYGAAVWAAVTREARVGVENFEPMLPYDQGSTHALLEASAQMLGRSRDSVLEDLGIYLVSHPNIFALRRLLRFGGVSYVDFIHSLEDLQGRARLALPELRMPELELIDHSSSEFTLICYSNMPGTGSVVVGILRAMADDYGVLCLVEHRGFVPAARPAATEEGVQDQLQGEIIGITLAATAHTAGRRFDLAMGVSGV